MFKRIIIPPFCERVIGLSVPQGNELLVVSYEGRHLIHLGQPVTVESDSIYREYDRYDPETGLCQYQNRDWQVFGLHPGKPLLTSPRGEQIEIDRTTSSLAVVAVGHVLWSSDFENFSGDWVAATFSPDGRFIILGCPYDFDFRLWERTSHSTLPASQPSD